jgi:hypothetical protein
MKKPAQHLIAEVPRRQAKVEITIGIDPGDVWSHYCTLNQGGEVVHRCGSSAGGDGGRNTLDLDQRTAARARPRSHRGEHPRVACDLAQ